MAASSGGGMVSCHAGSAMTRSDNLSRLGNVPAGKFSGYLSAAKRATIVVVMSA